MPKGKPKAKDVVKEKRPPFRFTNEIEIALFKETINIVPFNYDGNEWWDAWKEVADNTCMALGIEQEMFPRTAKEKVFDQVKYYRANNERCLKKSGTNEDLTEKKNLLQEICDLIESGAEVVAMKNAELKAKEKEEKKKLRLKQKGEDIRLRAMQGLKDSDDEELEEEQRIADTEEQETGTEGAEGGEDPGETANEAAVATTSTSKNAKKTKVSHSSKQMSFLDVLRVKFEGENKAKEESLKLEARKLALQEREMTLRENEAKAKAEESRDKRQRLLEQQNFNTFVGLPPMAGQPTYEQVKDWNA